MNYLKGWKAYSDRFVQSRKARIAAWVVAAVLIVYGLAGWFGVPVLLRHILKGQVATAMSRPVDVGRIVFNPYRLRLEIDRLHIGGRDSNDKFVDVGHIHVKVSWNSLWRLAPVVHSLAITAPVVHIVRNPDGSLNFSDLTQSKTPPEPPKPGAKPQRFSVSNIELHQGEIHFDDKLAGSSHDVEHVELGVPFIANLPSAIDVYVQPLLKMVVDGSPFAIMGRAKPFATPPESVLDINIHKFDLPKYAGYIPKSIPIGLPAGTFSSQIELHFVNDAAGPQVRLNGEVALDGIDLRDKDNAPLLGLRHLAVRFPDIQPLHEAAHIESVSIEGLDAHLTLNADGTTNITPITGASPPASSTQAEVVSPTSTPSAAPTAAPAQPAAEKPPLDFSLATFKMIDSSVEVADRIPPQPVELDVKAIHASLNNFALNGQGASPFDFGATLGGGGSIGIKGSLDYPHRQVDSELAIDQVDLPALQGLSQPTFAGTIASGKFGLSVRARTNFGPNFNVHVEPAKISLDKLDVRSSSNEKPLALNNLTISVAQVDLASQQAVVEEVRADAIQLAIHRSRSGAINLLSLIRQEPPKRPPAREPRRPRRAARSKAAPKAPPEKSPSWQYRVASVLLDKTQVSVQDDTTKEPVKLTVAPLKVGVKNITSDFAKPFSIDIDGKIGRFGSFATKGNVAVAPLKADLRVETKRIDLAIANPYLAQSLNASIMKALFSNLGTLAIAQTRGAMSIGYRGDAMLGSVVMDDRLTNEPFVRWNTFKVGGIDFATGKGPMKAHVESVGLSEFYARVILNSDGKLNLSDVARSPQEAAVSLTREKSEANEQPAAPTPSPTPAAPAASPTPSAPEQGASPPADIDVGGITFNGGHVVYTDDFIKPNYEADLTDLEGKVGQIGTTTTQPADVAVSGKVNGNAPVEISGKVNPLAPTAYVDIAAKASDIELQPLTPYSTRYTGYPITKGTLSVDVKYLLDQQNLTATNHIFIDQLTFGPRIESPTATSLPVALAVAILKNPKGEIDLNVPISGSLNNPQFSIGSVLWHALLNIITKAALSPFTLLASIAGGGGADQPSYIEFAPGRSRLDDASRKRLEEIAKGLDAKPQLKLGLSGRVDPSVDREALRHAKVDDAVREQKIEDIGAKGADADKVVVMPDEYNKYLWRAYKAAKFDKPKNAIGLTKSLEPDEVRKLMLEHASANDEDLKGLANARVDAVLSYLSTKMDKSRILVTAPKLDASGITDKGKTTRVDLSLQ